MDMQKFISSVDQVSHELSEANERDILVNTRNKFHISKHTYIIILCII